MKKSALFLFVRRMMVTAILLAAGRFCQPAAHGNPVGASVSQGTASIANQGSQMTIQTSDKAFINWQSFNIGAGETTTFLQPSSSSVVFNQINDPNPSQILGNLNANGYVILENQSGFYVGGDASISAHSLILTTAHVPMPDLSGAGPWEFDTPPPAAKIVNYGQINVDKGGSVFLIANNIANYGGILAPEGNIGLYAGKQVLVSERPDGRGLSAQVTLPQGSVDNSGKLIADAGTIAVNAQVVNQGGLVQANSVRQVNGTIELVAGDSLNLGPTSVISAKGDADVASPGGSITLQSANSFQDSPTSTIDVSGGAQGGNGGQLEISAASMDGLQSHLLGGAAAGWQGGSVVLDPAYTTLVAGSGSSGSGSSASDPLLLGVDSFAGFSQIDVQASQDIILNTLWTLPDQAAPSQLILQAGNNITFNANTGISAGKNWAVNLYAGADLTQSTPTVIPGVGTITLNANNPITTAGGSISLQAAQDIVINSPWILPSLTAPAALSLQAGNNIDFMTTGSLSLGSDWSANLSAGGNFQPNSAVSAGNGGVYFSQFSQSSYIASLNGDIDIEAFNEVQVGEGGISTYGGGNIFVDTLMGDINCGTSPLGYKFSGKTGNSLNAYTLGGGIEVGGISTAAGGNVTLSAGQNVISLLPPSRSGSDAGSGAFGSAPGIVRISAGGNVTGHYIAVNSTVNGVPVASSITAGGNAGTAAGLLALSLVKGGWTVSAPNGSIDLQEVRNPNGTLNSASGAKSQLFNYDPLSFVTLDAGNQVQLGSGLSISSTTVPIIFPPSLTILAGPGGVQLDNNVTLFPSPSGELNITTTGGGSFYALQSASSPQTEAGINYELNMSDSSSSQWVASQDTFGDGDHAAVPIQLANPNPVVLNISGNLSDLTLAFPKEADITVGGNMLNTGLLGQNLRPGDITSVTVTGQLLFRTQSTYYQLTQPLPDYEGSISEINTILQYAFDANGQRLIINPPVINYNPATQQISIVGKLSQSTYQSLSQIAYTQLFINGVAQFFPAAPGTIPQPVLVPVTFLTPAALAALYANSQDVPDNLATGLQVAGPGAFKVTAGSISLPDNGAGIASTGAALNVALAPFANTGANIDVTTTSGDLDMNGSFISTYSGGGITVNSAGAVNVGTVEDFGFADSSTPRGIYVESTGNLSVTAEGDINVAGSRIETFGGGNISILSQNGDVDAGNGSEGTFTPIIYSIDSGSGQVLQIRPTFSGSGIEALTLPATLTGFDPVSLKRVVLNLGSSALPGNISISTPNGNIVASSGGILQEPLDGNTAAGPFVNLSAGSRDNQGNVSFVGNIDVSGSGVIGEAVTATATGTISGLLVGSQSVTVAAVQSFNGTVVSAGQANISASTIAGNIIAVGGINVGAGSVVTGNLLSQTVSGAGQAAGLANTASASSTATSASANANDTAQQQVASAYSQDDDPLKKKGKGPLLARRVSRVTVMLPKG
jgi:filamentous hemagglutinin family protein